MSSFYLKREPDLTHDDPTLETVFEVMNNILEDEQEPAVTIDCKLAAGDNLATASQLLIARLNEPQSGGFAGWAVSHWIPRSSESHILADASPTKEAFKRFELFGVIENIRIECALGHEKVAQAVEWYLRHGTRDPSLIWLKYSDGVKEYS